MNENNFMKVEDVAKELGISISHSYKIMQQLNKELKAKGYMTIAGRVNRKYFMEKFCYVAIVIARTVTVPAIPAIINFLKENFIHTS